jgi:hypothetical protein
MNPTNIITQATQHPKPRPPRRIATHYITYLVRTGYGSLKISSLGAHYRLCYSAVIAVSTPTIVHSICTSESERAVGQFSSEARRISSQAVQGGPFLVFCEAHRFAFVQTAAAVAVRVKDRSQGDFERLIVSEMRIRGTFGCLSGRAQETRGRRCWSHR